MVGGSKEEVPGDSSSILPVEKMEDGRFFVLRVEKLEDGVVLPSSEEEVPTPPSSVRSSTHSSGLKIEDGGFFDLRL